MEIKNGSEYKSAYVGCPLLEIIYLVYCFMNGFDEKSISLIGYLSIVNVVLLLMLPVIWRVIILDKYGCTVKLFGYKRTYQWSELSIKRIEKNKQDEWIFFSVNPVKKSIGTDPFAYCMFRHPLTCFYVMFVQEQSETVIPKKGRVAGCRKEVIMDKMKEWNVRLIEN